jgi:hypothetical protein
VFLYSVIWEKEIKRGQPEMTKEEILTIKPGRELNILVAEVVMKHKVIVDEIFGDMERPIDGDDKSVWDTLPLYSEDMSAAQLVVEKMVTLGHSDAVSWEHYGNGIYTQAEAICKRALLVGLGLWDEQEDIGLTTNEGENREELLNKIIEIELRMFEQVRTSEPSLCKERPETFRVMRGMTHSVLSTRTLQSYLQDLQKAKAEGRNLLTEKYARMDNRIPPIKTNRLIDDIVKIESRWMRELSQKYPHSFKGESGSFELYFSSELETYSDETLKLYFDDISRAEKKGTNLAEEGYTKLFQQIGYSSIGEMERKKEQEIV